MNVAETIDVQGLLRDSTSFGTEEINLLEQVVSGAQASEVRQMLESMAEELAAGQGDNTGFLKAGIAAFFLADIPQAEQHLSRVENSGLATYYLAQVLMSAEKYEAAGNKFAEAGKLGYDPIECTLRQAGAIRSQGQLDDAEALLKSVAIDGASRAEYSFAMGCICADRGDAYGAIEYFERAVDMDSHHSRALFWLAGENNLRGNDDEAVRLYEQSLSKPPLYLGALINLGLLYEDAENYKGAAFCFRRVLELEPNNEQAVLYLKDIEAVGDMHYDEESARREAQLKHLLSRNISDFELSVRSRNCLQYMDIHTVENLCSVTEEELLAGKNFGQTSLDEIREMMTALGLQIGQELRDTQSVHAYVPEVATPEAQAMLNKPISDLNLSVRSRKCMTRLGITTFSELLSRSADQLLSSRNFGVTSLNEIREKLTEIDLKLRND